VQSEDGGAESCHTGPETKKKKKGGEQLGRGRKDNLKLLVGNCWRKPSGGVGLQMVSAFAF